MTSKPVSSPWQSARLTYRALEPEDELFVHTLDSEVFNFINMHIKLKRPQSKADNKKRFDQLINENILAVVICTTAEDNNPIGVVNLTSLEEGETHHRYSEIGINLVPSQQGKGYGSEAIKWTLHWAFESAGLHRVSCRAFEYNTGARRLYERLGFVHEGTARETWWHEGRWWADVEYGILEGEWRARQQEEKANPLVQ